MRFTLSIISSIRHIPSAIRATRSVSPTTIAAAAIIISRWPENSALAGRMLDWSFNHMEG